MNDQLPPNITSFVIRFVVEPADKEQASLPYRGTVRHIQTDQEQSFSTWKEVVSFIQRYVPLEEGSIG